MRFCSSPGWLIISFGFFRLSFLGGLKQLQPRSSSSSSSSSSSHPHHHHHHHHHHHQAILIIKPSSSSSSSSRSSHPHHQAILIIIIIIIIIHHHHHHHHHHHPFLAAISPIGISGFFSPTKNPTPPPTLPADFSRFGDGGMWHVPPKQTNKNPWFQTRKTPRYFEKQTYGCFRKLWVPPNHPF